MTNPKKELPVWQKLRHWLDTRSCGQESNISYELVLEAEARGRALERVAIAAKECWGQSCDGFIAYTLEFQSALRDLDRMTVSSNEVKPKEIV